MSNKNYLLARNETQLIDDHTGAGMAGGHRATAWAMWVVAACVAPFVIVGCGGAPPAPTSTVASGSLTAAQTQRSVQSSIPTGSGPLFRNTSTVYTRCTDKTAQLFDPVSGTVVNIPQPPLASTEQVESSACTVTTLADGHQRVIYLITVITPSQGLNPETKRTDMVVMDPSSTKPVAVKPFPLTKDDNNWYLYPATNGFSVAHTLGGTSIDETITDVAFFDANTLEMTSQAHPDADHPLGGVNYDGYLTLDGVNAHIFSGADGSELYMLPNADGLLYPVDHGFLLQHSPGGEPGVQYFDMTTKSLTGPIAPGLDGNGSFDPRSGRRQRVRRHRDARRRIVQAPHRGVRHGSQEGPVQPRRGKARRPVDLGCPSRRSLSLPHQ